jgi:hypothetical protein
MQITAKIAEDAKKKTQEIVWPYFALFAFFAVFSPQLSN